MKIALLSIIALLTTVSFQACSGGSSTGSLSVNYKYYAYVANYSDNTISCFSMDKETGQLTLIETVSAGVGGSPNGLAVNKSGDKLFVTKENVNSVQANIQIFNISKTTGVLTAFQNVKAGDATGTDPATSITFSIDGKFAFVATDHAITPKVTTYSISSLTGMLNYSSVANVAKPSRITVHPSGNYLILSGGPSNALYSHALNSATGVVTSAPIASVSLTSPETIQISEDGSHIYSGSYGSGDVKSYDFNSGAFNFIETKIVSNTTRGLALSSTGTILLALGSNGGDLQSFLVNISNGTITLADSKTVGSDPRYIVFNSDNNFAYTVNENSNNVSVFRVDQDTAQLTFAETVSVGTKPYAIAFVDIGQ